MFFIILLACFNAQAIQPEPLIKLIDKSDWCSDKEYNFINRIAPDIKSSCSTQSAPKNLWFSFVATSSNLELNVTASHYNKETFIATIWDTDYNEIGCVRSKAASNSLTSAFKGLEERKSYYVQISSSEPHNTSSRFSLCLKDEISNSFLEGAVMITNTDHWCSPKGKFTTSASIADRQKGSCLTSGPNFNRWFSFVAVSEAIDITLKPGSAEFPYLTLWDESLREISCSGTPLEEKETAIVQSDKLIPGETYYLSVDHEQEGNCGTFSLCFSNNIKNRLDDGFHIISGVVQNKDNQPTPMASIDLLDHDYQLVGQMFTGSTGKFKFNDLLPSQQYYIRYTPNDSTDNFNVLRTDAKNQITNKTIEIEKNLFAFTELPKALNGITLVDFDKISEEEIEVNKLGIAGKVVYYDELVDGVGGLKVYLYDQPGNVVDSAYTDEVGSFKFNNVSADNQNLIKLANSDFELYAEMVLVNHENSLIGSSSNTLLDTSGYFEFEKLPSLVNKLTLLDEIDESWLSGLTTLVLPNIQFNLGEHVLHSSTYPELDEMAQFLLLFPNIRLEICGHTDASGSSDVNLTISHKRANAVKDYLLSWGVKESQLTTVGLGDSTPLASNESSKGQAQNRRVEFKVISR